MIWRCRFSPFLTPHLWIWLLRPPQQCGAGLPTAGFPILSLSPALLLFPLCQSRHHPFPSGIHHMVFFFLFSFSTPSEQILAVLPSKYLLTYWPVCGLSCLSLLLDSAVACPSPWLCAWAPHHRPHQGSQHGLCGTQTWYSWPPVWGCSAAFLCSEECLTPSLSLHCFLWCGLCTRTLLTHVLLPSCPELPGPRLAWWWLLLALAWTLLSSRNPWPSPLCLHNQANSAYSSLFSTLLSPAPTPASPELIPPSSLTRPDPVGREHLFCSPLMLCCTAPVTPGCPCLFNSLSPLSMLGPCCDFSWAPDTFAFMGSLPLQKKKNYIFATGSVLRWMYSKLDVLLDIHYSYYIHF